MLKKLLKYDLKSVFKVLIIFYSLALVFSGLTRVFLNIENSFIMNIIGQICSGVTISMIFNILINNLMRIWVRFKQNFYGDESYLTHTLPVLKSTLYLSKFFSAIITLLTSTAVIAVTLFVAYYSKENMQILKGILLPVAQILDSNLVVLLLAFLFVFFLELGNALQAGFTGIILGHRMNNAKTGLSVLFGFAAYIVTQYLALVGVFVVALFNKDFMNLFFTNEIINMGTVKVILYMAIAIYTVLLGLGCFVNIKLLKKGVNVE